MKEEEDVEYPSKPIEAGRFPGTPEEFAAFQKRQKLLGEAIEKIREAGFKRTAEQVSDLQRLDYYLRTKELMPR